MKKLRKKRGRNNSSFLLGVAAITIVILAFGALLISAKVREHDNSKNNDPTNGQTASDLTMSDAESTEVIIPDDLDIPEKLTAASNDHFAWIVDGGLAVNGSEIDGQAAAAGWSNLVQCDIADDHIVGLDSDGTAHAAGNNSNLQCGLDGQPGYICVAAGLNCSAAVFFDGTIDTFGTMPEEIRNALAAEKNAKQVAFGEGTAVVLRDDGSVACVGSNDYGECNVEKWKDIVMIAAGTYCTVGLTGDGKVLIAGDNTYHQKDAEKWSDIAYIAAGGRHVVGLKTDGTVVAVGRNDHGECDLSEWKDVISVAAGYDHTLGLTKTGDVIKAGYDLNTVSEAETVS